MINHHIIGSKADHNPNDWRFARCRTDADRTQFVKTPRLETWLWDVAVLLGFIAALTTSMWALSHLAEWCTTLGLCT